MYYVHTKKYKCEYVHEQFIDPWKYALDNDKFVGTLLIDLSKAFDCIPHGLLIAKMKAYGLSDEACTFMSSYICDRYHRVKISNTKSSWTKLTKGIPQGSGLGPFCDLVNYADDNTLSVIERIVQMVLSELKKDAENAMTWFKDNFMQANPEKFQFMFLKKYTSKEHLWKCIFKEN